MAIHSSGQTISRLAHIEGITQGAGEKVDEVAGGAGGMGMDGMVRLVTGLVKDRLLGCMGQILQWGLWKGKEPGVDYSLFSSFLSA